MLKPHPFEWLALYWILIPPQISSLYWILVSLLPPFLKPCEEQSCSPMLSPDCGLLQLGLPSNNLVIYRPSFPKLHNLSPSRCPTQLYESSYPHSCGSRYPPCYLWCNCHVPKVYSLYLYQLHRSLWGYSLHHN